MTMSHEAVARLRAGALIALAALAYAVYLNWRQKPMKTQGDKGSNGPDELREHYELDYSEAKPNRFAARLDQESVMVVLEPDIAAAFPTAEAVNDALRLVVRLSAIPAVKLKPD
jgi:uncharacterized membrane protein YebE (DUF533 family)